MMDWLGLSETNCATRFFAEYRSLGFESVLVVFGAHKLKSYLLLPRRLLGTGASLRTSFMFFSVFSRAVFSSSAMNRLE